MTFCFHACISSCLKLQFMLLAIPKTPVKNNLSLQGNTFKGGSPTPEHHKPPPLPPPPASSIQKHQTEFFSQLNSSQRQLQLGLLISRIHVQVDQAAGRPRLGRALQQAISRQQEQFLICPKRDIRRKRNSPNQDTPRRPSASAPSAPPRGSSQSCACTRSGAS